RPTPTFACFDVPGAGKTAVAINAHIQQARFPALITVPAHLVLQWRNELLRWDVPEDEIGYCPRGMGPRERLSYLASDRAFQLVTYNMWSSPMYRELLLSYGWSSYSFDESHRLRKGRLGKGGAWTPISHLRTKTRSKHMQTPLWLFSGTPIVKDATDVYPLLHLVNPYRYSSRNDFATEWCRTSTTPYGMHVGPLRDPSRFHALLGRHSIRRSWKEIPELAGLKRRDIQLPVELSPADLARHRGIKRDYRDPLTSLPVYSSSGMIHMLRRVSAAAKCAVLPELIEDHPGRWLILSWYKDTARLAQSSLRNVSLPVSYVDGSTSEGKREKALEIYRKGGILVGTLGALETGLNLQVGYQVAFVEQHWLSTTNEQAVARVLRRGQSQPVLVYWLYCPKSFDMRVRSVADRREADIHRALDGFIDDEEWTE
ncbi:MAG TPA: SNF2-related protein, partial [Nitrospira sp.]|nr:SNF2-related protein [Nitrospira sp.]